MTKNLVFQLYFFGGKTHPGPARAMVRAANLSSFDDARNCVTPVCVSFQELEREVGQLHKELDAVLELARQKFEAAG
jgi:hypothetical protein